MTRSAWATICAMAALACTLMGCGGPAEEWPASASSAAATPMQRRLAALAAKSGEENPYLSTKHLDEARRSLATLGPDGTDERRLQLLLVLGIEESKHGRDEEAIGHLEQARTLALAMEAGTPQPRTLGAIFALAMANLRWGETRNCVALHTAQSCIFPIQGSGVHQDQRGSRRGIELLLEILRRSPDFLLCRWLLNIAAMTVGEYPDGVAPEYLIPASAYASDEPFPRFLDVSPELGLNLTTKGGGAVIDDFDGDGFLDIITSTYDLRDDLRYWKNDGGSFTDRSVEAGFRGIGGGWNLVQTDYDGDGLLDVYVMRGAWIGKNGTYPNSLLRNVGGARFVDVTYEAGLAGDGLDLPTRTAAWADFDGDGDLDLFVGNESTNDVAFPCQLFRNRGDGRFEEIGVAAGIATPGRAMGAVWGDVDEDGDPDLFVSMSYGPNRLYRNEGDGTFTDVAGKMGVTKPLQGSVAFFWDYDQDGHLDLFAGEHQPDVTPVAASYLGLPHRAECSRLYRGDGRGGFTDVTDAVGLGRVSFPQAANFGDLDLDGWPDFYLGTGFSEHHGLMPNVMYRNQGGGSFADITVAGGFGHLQKGNAVAFADLDHDGDLDVFENIGGLYPEDGFGNVLFENPGFPGRSWVRLRLVGTAANRAAIGAHLRLRITDGGERWLHARVSSGGSFGAQSVQPHLGLGAATRIDTLEVTWPGSGAVQTFRDVPVRGLVTITEGDEDLTVTPLPAAPFRK